ncbi:MAG: DUF6476 family protein [Albidovulum sp.]
MSDIEKAPVDAGPEGETPPQLRFLKALVTILTGTMILGLITIIVLFVMRFPTAEPQAPLLPGNLTLPEGVKAEAVTFGRGWIAVVTADDEILILDAKTGAVRQRLTLTDGN